MCTLAVGFWTGLLVTCMFLDCAFYFSLGMRFYSLCDTESHCLSCVYDDPCSKGGVAQVCLHCTLTRVNPCPFSTRAAWGTAHDENEVSLSLFRL